MASPPQVSQPPFYPRQGPPKKKHPARTVLLLVGTVFVLLAGIGIAAGGGDAKPGTAGDPNPATAPVASKATAPKPSATVVPPAGKVACADQEDRSAPCVVTVGSAFALGKHQVLAGWTIEDSGFGMTIAGQAKNIIDGASTLGIWWRIVLPALRPAMVVLALLTFMLNWNEFLWPFMVLSGENPTIQLAIRQLSTATWSADLSMIFTGTLISIIPIAILFVVFGRQIVSGIMEGSSK